MHKDKVINNGYFDELICTIKFRKKMFGYIYVDLDYRIS